MLYEVIRPLPINGQIIQPGERVDGSDWPEANRRALVSQRYIQPVTVSPEAPKRGVESETVLSQQAAVGRVRGASRARPKQG
jgi:hypothetical protein